MVIDWLLIGTSAGHECRPAPLARRMVDLLGQVHSYGDLQRVAGRSGTTAQGVLKQVRRLELSVGDRVVVATGRRLSLTDLGHRLLGASRVFYHHLDCALGRLHDSRTSGRLLQVASSVPLDAETIHEITMAGLPVPRTAVQGGVACIGAFEDYEADAAVLWTVEAGDLGVRRDHCVTTIIDDPLWVVLPAGHPLADRERLGMGDLVAESWTSALCLRGEPLVRRVFNDAGLPPPGLVRTCESFEIAQCLAVRQGTMTLQPLSMIPASLWGFARPLEDLTVGRMVLITDRTADDAVRERLAMVLRRQFLSHHVERVAGGRWDVELGRWRRRQAKRLAESVPPEPVEAHVSGLRNHPLDRDDIRVLVAVQQHGSINRAAGALCMSQPALTRRLQRLEADVGVQMLFRSSQGAQPTEILELLLSGVEQASRYFTARFAAPVRPETGQYGARSIERRIKETA